MLLRRSLQCPAGEAVEPKGGEEAACTLQREGSLSGVLSLNLEGCRDAPVLPLVSLRRLVNDFAVCRL